MLSKEQISANFAEGLRLMDEFPVGAAPAQKAARKIARTLEEMGIPYVVADGLAVHAHGHKRATVDVDLIMTKSDLAKFKERWLGLGWVEKFKGSKGLRDAEFDVKVDILTPDEIPGDGKVTPFHFPDPATVGTDVGGIWAGIKVLDLRTLIELKLASGLSSPHRPQDLADVIQLIRANKLPRDYATQLHEYTRAKYDELWGCAQVEEDS